MPVCKTYFKIFKKLRTSLLLYAFLFIGLTFVYTFNSSVKSETYEATKVKTMIINQDGKSPLIDGFENYLKQYAKIVEAPESEEEIKDALFFGQAEYILTIPKGFSESFTEAKPLQMSKQIIPDYAGTMALDSIIDNYFNMARVYLKQVPNLSYDDLNSYIKKNLSNETKTLFSVKVKDDVATANEFNQFFFNFLGYIIIATFISGISMIMFSFNGVDIRRRHTASPLSYQSMNMQLLLANLVFVIGYLILFIAVGLIINKSHIITPNLLFTWLNTFVFSLTALSISYLVGISMKSRKAIGALSTGLSLGLAFISGLFVPQQYLGSELLRFASFTPTYWFAKANNIFAELTTFNWKDVSVGFGCMAVEIGFTIAIISIALVISKRKRQQAF